MSPSRLPCRPQPARPLLTSSPRMEMWRVADSNPCLRSTLPAPLLNGEHAHHHAMWTSCRWGGRAIGKRSVLLPAVILLSRLPLIDPTKEGPQRQLGSCNAVIHCWVAASFGLFGPFILKRIASELLVFFAFYEQ